MAPPARLTLPSARPEALWLLIVLALSSPAHLEAQWLETPRFVEAEPCPVASCAAMLPETPRALPVDTPMAELARRAGLEAANERAMHGRAIFGFLGGLPMGFVLPHGLSGQFPEFLIGWGVGAPVVLFSAFAGPDPPNERVLESLPGEAAAHEAEFREAYLERLKDRQFDAAIWGAVAGMAAGFVYLLANIPYT